LHKQQQILMIKWQIWSKCCKSISTYQWDFSAKQQSSTKLSEQSTVYLLLTITLMDY